MNKASLLILLVVALGAAGAFFLMDGDGSSNALLDEETAWLDEVSEADLKQSKPVDLRGAAGHTAAHGAISYGNLGKRHVPRRGAAPLSRIRPVLRAQAHAPATGDAEAVQDNPDHGSQAVSRA